MKAKIQRIYYAVMAATVLTRLTRRGSSDLGSRTSSRGHAYTHRRTHGGFQVRESAVWAAGFSVEERLRSARERYRLLADLFNLQAEAGLSAQGVRLSGDGLLALRQLCTAAAEDLERLARELPPAIANWRAEPERRT